MLKSLDFTRVLTSFIFRYLPINSVIFFTIPEWLYNSKSVCLNGHMGSNPILSATLSLKSPILGSFTFEMKGYIYVGIEH